MAETYVTLTEAAELEGIKSKTMARRTSVTEKVLLQKRKSLELVERTSSMWLFLPFPNQRGTPGRSGKS